MIPKKYQLAYTDTTHIEMDRLVKNGQNIRDVLNAGIILFKNASHEQRGMAHLEAYSRPIEDFKNALNVICQTNVKLLSEEDSKIFQGICKLLGPEKDCTWEEKIESQVDSGERAVTEAAVKEIERNKSGSPKVLRRSS